MRSSIACFVGVALCLAIVGCGESTQSAIQRAARRKRPPDSPETPAAADDNKSPEVDAKLPPDSPQEPKVATSGDSAKIAAAAPLEGSAPAKSNERPNEPQSEVERRAWSIANLEKIAQALVAYEKKNNRLPRVALDRDGDLLLSWRVLILPELGYPELASRFRHDEAWDGNTNKLLLDYIPPEYQSPERFDNKTNYLAVTGQNGVFGPGAGRRMAQIKDGVDSTLAIVEVDDKYAQEWTKPSDHTPAMELPLDRLGGLRGEGAFGILASGRVVVVPKEQPPSRWAALFTAAGGEPIGAATFLKAPTAEPPPPTLATIADDPETSNLSLPVAENGTVSKVPASTARLSLPGAVDYVPDATKYEIPGEVELAKARELLKELYGREYEKGGTLEKRRQLAKKLLAEAPNMDQSPPDFHEVLRIARDLATGSGDTQSALAASDLLEQRFQIDSLAARLKTLEELSKRGKLVEPVAPAIEEAKRIVREASEIDRYDVAVPAQELVLTFTRLNETSTRKDLSRLEQEIDSLKAASSLHSGALKALQAIEQGSSDPENNETIGRYLCLVKNRWDAGLPYLAKAADIRLRGVASLEMASDRSQEQTLTLADQMWDMALHFKQPQRRGMQLRSIYWYQAIAPKMSGSLIKQRIDRRLDEAVSAYGQEEVDRVLAPLWPNDAAKLLSKDAAKSRK